jgi:hypothetical protein
MGVVTAFAMVDMVRNNRRKNQSFVAEEAQRQENLKTALRAFVRGEATDDQVLLINQYKSLRDSEEKRLQNRSSLSKAMDFSFPTGPSVYRASYLPDCWAFPKLRRNVSTPTYRSIPVAQTSVYSNYFPASIMKKSAVDYFIVNHQRISTMRLFRKFGVQLTRMNPSSSMI